MALKLKFRSIFPALVKVTSPLTLVKDGLKYTFGINTSGIASALGSDSLGNILGSATSPHPANPGKAAMSATLAYPPNSTVLNNALQVAIGTPIPSGQQFGCNNNGVPQAIVGTINIPVGDTTTFQTAGVAGYAITNMPDRGTSTGPGAVGIFGQGQAGVANSNVFGGSFIATNSNGDQNSIGHDMNYMAGAEIDVLVWQKAGAVNATINGGNVHGLTIAGSSNMTAVISQSSAVVVDRLSVFTDIAWDYAYQTYAGAARTALLVGPAASTGTSDSQYIDFQYLAGGAPTRGARIKCDTSANLILKSGPNAVVSLQDDVGTSLLNASLSYGGGKVRIPAFTVAGVVTNDVTTGQLNSVTTLPSALTYPNPLFSGAVGSGIAMGGNNISGAGTITATTFSGALTGHASLDLALAGGTMAGGITMGGNAIVGVSTVAGGSGTTGTQLTLQTTTGNGTTDAFAFKGGNAGATTFATLQTGSFNLQSGSTYSINGTAVLSGSALGSGITSSSLTSLGTITSLTATTINAFTQGGNISGGGFQHNNVIIGASTPLAGTFTTLAGNTSITSPLHYGGSSVGSTATLNGTSSGSPSSAYVLLQSGTTQFVGINNASPKTTLDINKNTASSPALVVATSLARMQAADTANGGMEWISYGAANGNFLTGAVAGGTSAVPLATPGSQNMFNLSGWGWTGSAWAKGAIITMGTTSLWSGSNQATEIDFYTTPTGSTILTLAASILPSGGFSVGTTADPGTGMIFTNAAAFMTRTKTSWSSGAAAAVGTLANAPAAGNPTKWIPVDDNGTTRYIPAW